MLCDDTVECLCSVFRNQDNAIKVDNRQSARLSTVLSIFHNSKFALIWKFILIC